MNWLLGHLPALGVAATRICAESLSRAPRTDRIINLIAWATNLLAALSVYQLVHSWQGAALVDAARLPGWLAVILFILVYDLGEYLLHRLQHRIPLLWAMHSLHHSDPEMSALTTSRHYWADPLFKTITVWSVCAMVITPSPAAFLVYMELGLWNFVTHSQLKIDLGRWSLLINTPVYHRRRHSSDPAHYDSNFAALFPLWACWRGTITGPMASPPPGLNCARAR